MPGGRRREAVGRGRCGRRSGGHHARRAGPGPRRGAAEVGGAGAGSARRGGSAPGGMFRKARRVNVRKRNDSEEEDEERDEEPPQESAPASGAGGEGPGEASAVALAAAGTGLLPLPPGCVPLALPGSPAAFACAAGYGAALGLGLGLMGGDRAGLGALSAPSLLPPPPPPPPQGNGLPAAGRPKEKKRPRENKEVPRASLLSFQDEEEGEATVAGLALRRGSVCYLMAEELPRNVGCEGLRSAFVRAGIRWQGAPRRLHREVLLGFTTV